VTVLAVGVIVGVVVGVFAHRGRIAAPAWAAGLAAAIVAALLAMVASGLSRSDGEQWLAADMVYVVSLADGRSEPLLPERGFYGDCAWAPDGGPLAVAGVAAAGATGSLELMDARGDAPAFSPDGRNLAYAAGGLDVGGAPTVELHVVSVEGRSDRLLVTRPGDLEDLVWAPDGDRIALVTNLRRIVTMPAHEDRLAVIVDVATGEMQPFKPGPASPGSLSWAPDGERLVFDSLEEPGIFVAYTDGSELEQVADDGHAPAWSPNRDLIAFKRDEPEGYGIWMMDADGENQRKLASAPTGPPFATGPLHWSPDGNLLAWWACHAMWPEITVMPTAGGEPRTVATIHTFEPAFTRLEARPSLRSICERLSGANKRPEGDLREYSFTRPRPAQIAWSGDSTRIAYTSEMPKARAARDANLMANRLILLPLGLGPPVALIGCIYGCRRRGSDRPTVLCAVLMAGVTLLTAFVVFVFLPTLD